MVNVAPCSCIKPGFCSRHNISRGKTKWEWCQKNDDYRAQWDKIAAEIAEAEGREANIPVPEPIEEIPKDPSLLQRAKNFGQAVKEAAKHYQQTGEFHVDQERYQKRLEICRNCPSNLFNADKGTCRHMGCGCFLTRKARWISTHCPMKHWEEKGV